MNKHLKTIILFLTFISSIAAFGQNVSYSYEQQKILFEGDWEIHGKNYYNDIKIIVISHNHLMIAMRETNSGSYFPTGGQIHVVSLEGKILKFKIVGVKGWNTSIIFSIGFDEQELCFRSPQFTIIRTEDMLEYKTTTIKDQIWMVKNLNTTKLADGTKIKYISTDSESIECERNKIPACCYYGFDPANGRKYGMLYNYWALKGILPPDGWRIPSIKDYEKLKANVHNNGSYDALVCRNMWEKYRETSNTNSSGFCALPSGQVHGELRNHRYLNFSATWWLSDFTERIGQTGKFFIIMPIAGYIGSFTVDGGTSTFCGIRFVADNKDYNKSQPSSISDEEWEFFY